MGIRARGTVLGDREFGLDSFISFPSSPRSSVYESFDPILILSLDVSLHQYNETLNDLLGTEDFNKKKHEIKHEKIGRSTRTTVTDATLGESDYISHRS